MGRQQDTPFGETIFQARQARGWSLRQAAKALGVSYPRLDEYEKGVDWHSGKPVTPGYPIVMKMAEVYGLPVASLLAAAGYSLPKLPEDEQAVLDGYRQLDAQGRDRVQALIKTLLRGEG